MRGRKELFADPPRPADPAQIADDLRHAQQKVRSEAYRANRHKILATVE